MASPIHLTRERVCPHRPNNRAATNLSKPMHTIFSHRSIACEESQCLLQSRLKRSTISIIAIDYEQQMLGRRGEHCSRAIAGGRRNASSRISVEWQALDIQCPTPYPLIFVVGRAYAQMHLALDFVGIKQPCGVATEERNEIAHIDQRIDRIEAFALQCTTRQLFASRTITRGVFATGLIGGTRSRYGRLRFEAFGGEPLREFSTRRFDFLPQGRRGGSVAHLGFDIGAHKLRDSRLKFRALTY